MCKIKRYSNEKAHSWHFFQMKTGLIDTSSRARVRCSWVFQITASLPIWAAILSISLPVKQKQYIGESWWQWKTAPLWGNTCSVTGSLIDIKQTNTVCWTKCHTRTRGVFDLLLFVLVTFLLDALLQCIFRSGQLLAMSAENNIPPCSSWPPAHASQIERAWEKIQNSHLCGAIFVELELWTFALELFKSGGPGENTKTGIFSCSRMFGQAAKWKIHFLTSLLWFSKIALKHRNNCECCHHHSVFKGHNAIVHIVVLNCQKCKEVINCT